MKLLQYIYYFFRSVFYRGLFKTIRMLRDERVYEKRLNIRTSRIENPGQGGTDNHHYQGAGYSVLFEALRALPEQVRQKPFIDYGCGKGRALFVAEQCGFTQLLGVDIAVELLKDASENLKTYRQKNPQSRFEFILSDATQYPVPEDAAVFYFFNPFGESIMKKVVDNIVASAKTYPRDIYAVYINPSYRGPFLDAGFTVIQSFGSLKYTEALTFHLKPL